MQDINGHGVLVRQNDQVYCRRCGKTWDVTDPDPPKCKTGDDWIKEIRKCFTTQKSDINMIIRHSIGE